MASESFFHTLCSELRDVCLHMWRAAATLPPVVLRKALAACLCDCAPRALPRSLFAVYPLSAAMLHRLLLATLQLGAVAQADATQPRLLLPGQPLRFQLLWISCAAWNASILEMSEKATPALFLFNLDALAETWFANAAAAPHLRTRTWPSLVSPATVAALDWNGVLMQPLPDSIRAAAPAFAEAPAKDMWTLLSAADVIIKAPWSVPQTLLKLHAPWVPWRPLEADADWTFSPQTALTQEAVARYIDDAVSRRLVAPRTWKGEVLQWVRDLIIQDVLYAARCTTSFSEEEWGDAVDECTGLRLPWWKEMGGGSSAPAVPAVPTSPARFLYSLPARSIRRRVQTLAAKRGVQNPGIRFQSALRSKVNSASLSASRKRRAASTTLQLSGRLAAGPDAASRPRKRRAPKDDAARREVTASINTDLRALPQPTFMLCSIAEAENTSASASRTSGHLLEGGRA